MTTHEIIFLNRDVDALLVPSGARIFLRQGTEVTITQDLGDLYTVSIYGNLARINGEDADALGKVVKPQLLELPEGMSLVDCIWQQLKTCFDPEIPVNIVDLGLIYHCKVIELESGEHRIEINMTLTAPACGMGPVLAADVKRKIDALPTVKEVEVALVFDPPWDRSMISEGARLQLGLL